MPDRHGRVGVRTTSNRAELDGKPARSTCVDAVGPGTTARSGCANTYHFAYADGTPYFPHRHDVLRLDPPGRRARGADARDAEGRPVQQAADVRLLRSGTPTTRTSRRYPFAGNTAGTSGTSTASTPTFFRHLETRIGQSPRPRHRGRPDPVPPLRRGALGLRPHAAAADDRYLRYVVARLAAYRNVWWSLANEFDFMRRRRRRLGPAAPARRSESTRTSTCGRSTTAPRCTRSSRRTTSASRGSRTRACSTGTAPRWPPGDRVRSRSCSTRSATRAMPAAAGAT